MAVLRNIAFVLKNSGEKVNHFSRDIIMKFQKLINEKILHASRELKEIRVKGVRQSGVRNQKGMGLHSINIDD